MDWTLIRTKTGKTFAKDANDWLELFPSTKTVIQDLVNLHKFNIVIFTNQAGVAQGITKISDLQNKFK